MAKSPKEVIVEDSPDEFEDFETEKQFDEAFRLGKNFADNEEVANRAKRQVDAFLHQADAGWSERYNKWTKLYALWEHQSLSRNAEDYNIHLGLPFQKNEEFATKMQSSFYGGSQNFIGGEVEDEDDPERTELAVSLVQEVLETEANFRRDGLKHFRDAGIFGTRIGKLVPEKRIEYVLHREVEAEERPTGGVRYRFKEPEEKKKATTRIRCRPVSVFDFRISETADDIEDADSCGDFSYPDWEEIVGLIERGDYRAGLKQEVDDYLRSSEARVGSGHYGPGSDLASRTQWGVDKQFYSDQPDADPSATQFLRFEYWGNFDFDGNGERKPAVITMLYPSRNSTLAPGARGSSGWVARVERNPYLHQRKPYLYHPVIDKSGQFYSPGIMEIVGKSSHYEDELATAMLLQQWIESNPPLVIGEGADVTDEDLDGWIAGKTLHAEDPTQLRFLDTPRQAGSAANLVEYFQRKATDVAGLGQPISAPRVSASSTMVQAQEYDLRFAGFIDAYEQKWLKNAAELTFAYQRQYMTEERKIKTIGASGLRARDIRTVRPTDLATNMRFEPVVGKRVVQKAFQGQQMINWYDRAVSANMLRMQQGRPPLYREDEMGQFIFAEVFGVTDINRFMNATADPDDIRTPGEEHKLFRMGERPAYQKGENVMVHLNEHLDFFEAGGADAWRAEDRQAFVDHITRTADMFLRQLAAATPDAGEMMRQTLEQKMAMLGLDPTREMRAPGTGSTGYAPGGQQQVGSPLFRRETGSSGGRGGEGAQSNAMGRAPNMGAS